MTSTAEAQESSDSLVEYFDEVVYPWTRNGALLEFDASPQAIEPFGSDLTVGTRVLLTVGEWDGIESTIIGVRMGFLWRHDDGDRGARAFKGTDREYIESCYGPRPIGRVEVSGIRRALRVAKRDAGELSVRESPTKKGQLSTADALRPVGSTSAPATGGSTWRGTALPFEADFGRFAEDGALDTAALSKKSKVPVLHCPPVSAKFSPGSYPPLVVYDANPDAFVQFGPSLKPGMGVLLRRGPRAGQIVHLVGVFEGRLIGHPRDGGWPRDLDPNEIAMKQVDPVEQPLLLDDGCPPVAYRCGKGFGSYPEETATFRGVDYRTQPVAMLRSWGLLHGHRVQHQAGPRLGTVGIILGSKVGELFELNTVTWEVCALSGSDGMAIRANHGLVPVGCWCGAPPESATVPLIRLPAGVTVKSPRDEDDAFAGGQLRLDARDGTHAALRVRPVADGGRKPIPLVQGATVKMRIGRRFGQLGVVLGTEYSPPQYEAPTLVHTISSLRAVHSVALDEPETSVDRAVVWVLFDDSSRRLMGTKRQAGGPTVRGSTAASVADLGLTAELVDVADVASVIGRPRWQLPLRRCLVDMASGDQEEPGSPTSPVGRRGRGDADGADDDQDLASQPGYITVPSFCGDRIAIDTDQARCCSTFALPIGQRIVFCARSELTRLAASACAPLGDDASLVALKFSPFLDGPPPSLAALRAQLPPDWHVGVVLGVRRGEVWVLNEATQTATPLRGSSEMELMSRTHIERIGWRHPIDESVRDQYYDRKPPVAGGLLGDAASSASSAPPRALATRTFFEGPLQADDLVRPVAVLASTVSRFLAEGSTEELGDTASLTHTFSMTQLLEKSSAHKSLEGIADEVSAGGLSPFTTVVIGIDVSGAAFDTVGLGQLRRGDRIFHSPRHDPRLLRHRPRPSTGKSRGLPHDQWVHFGMPQWFTVLGVVDRRAVVLVQDEQLDGNTSNEVPTSTPVNNHTVLPAERVTLRWPDDLRGSRPQRPAASSEAREEEPAGPDSTADGEQQLVEAPVAHHAVPQQLAGSWLQAPPAEVKASVGTSSRPFAEEVVFPDYATVELDSRRVRAASNDISKSRAKEVRLSLAHLGPDNITDAIELMLSGFRVNYDPGDTLLRGCKLIAAVIDLFGQTQLRAPSAAQWAWLRCQRAIADEERLRRYYEIAEADEYKEILQRWDIMVARVGIVTVSGMERDAQEAAKAERESEWSMAMSGAAAGSIRLGASNLVPGTRTSPTTLLAQSVVQQRTVADVAGHGSATAKWLATVPPEGEHAAPTVDFEGSDVNPIDNPLVAVMRTASGAAAYTFEYILASGQRVVFDASLQACERFGLYHGQRWRVTRGDAAGNVCTILGVLGDRLWRYESDGLEAAPFAGESHRDIMNEHELVLEDDVPRDVCARWPAARSQQRRVRAADPFYFHTTDGRVLSFDIADNVLDAFGVRFGDRYCSSVALAPWRTRVFTCIGVNDGKLWVTSDWSGAYPFHGSNFAKDQSLVHLYQAGIKSLLRANAERAPRAVERNCIVVPVAGGRGTKALDCSKAACEPFGVFPGQLVQIGAGNLAQQQGVILGTVHGKLYRLVSGDRFANAFDATAADFFTSCAPKVLLWMRPKFDDVDEETSPELARRLSRFRFTTFSGPTAFFDTRPSVCLAVYGFTRGDVVNYSHAHRTNGAVRQAVIIGVRDGRLWKADKSGADRNVATMFVDCQRHQDLVESYHVDLVGFEQLSEHLG